MPDRICPDFKGVVSMGKFVGLNDHEWAVIEPLIPYPWGIAVSGTQPMHPESSQYLDLGRRQPERVGATCLTGEQWASKSCAHRYLGLWKENGILAAYSLHCRKFVWSGK